MVDLRVYAFIDVLLSLALFFSVLSLKFQNWRERDGARRVGLSEHL